jgi:hypothetical protein
LSYGSVGYFCFAAIISTAFARRFSLVFARTGGLPVDTFAFKQAGKIPGNPHANGGFTFPDLEFFCDSLDGHSGLIEQVQNYEF